MKKIKQQAKNFIKKYSLNTPLTVNSLNSILKRQNINLIKISNHNNDTVKLLNNLNLYEFSKDKNGFLYICGDLKFLFLKSSLDENNAVFTILHEEGHYCLNHLDYDGNVIYTVEQEREANNFAEFVIKYVKSKPFYYKIYKTVIGVAIILLLTTSNITQKHNNKITAIYSPEPTPLQTAVAPPTAVDNADNTVNEQIAVTSKGNSFHRQNCKWVSGKTNVIFLDRKEAVNAGYAPCLDCKP